MSCFGIEYFHARVCDCLRCVDFLSLWLKSTKTKIQTWYISEIVTYEHLQCIKWSELLGTCLMYKTSVAIPTSSCLNARVTPVECRELALQGVNITKSHFRGVCVCFSPGKSGIHLSDHLHLRVLSEDSGVWARIPRWRLFTELLEHTGLCHRCHGVRWDLDRRWISLQPKAAAHLDHIYCCIK